MDPRIHYFCLVFGLSSLAGLAWLLRTGRALAPRSIVSAILNGGLTGLIVVLLRYEESDTGTINMLGWAIGSGLIGSVAMDRLGKALEPGIDIFAAWVVRKAKALFGNGRSDDRKG